MAAVWPCTKFREPTGPNSPAQNMPAVGVPAVLSATRRASWLRSLNRRVPRPLHVKSRAPADFAPRVIQERKAGVYTWDVTTIPTTTALQVMKPAGVFDQGDEVGERVGPEPEPEILLRLPLLDVSHRPGRADVRRHRAADAAPQHAGIRSERMQGHRNRTRLAERHEPLDQHPNPRRSHTPSSRAPARMGRYKNVQDSGAG